MSRSASVQRETKETRIEVTLELDGSGQSSAKTGIGMLDHLVEQIGKHGLFDLSLTAKGDLQVDEPGGRRDTRRQICGRPAEAKPLARPVDSLDRRALDLERR